MIKEVIEAFVVQVLIDSDNCISYKCSWFDGNAHHAEWFRNFEVKSDPRQQRVPLKIGFTN